MSELLEICEVGKIRQIRKNIAIVEGLTQCFVGEVLSITRLVKGMVISFVKDEISLLLLGSIEEVKVGIPVYSKRELFAIPVGDFFIGRVINALAEPIDNKGVLTDKIIPKEERYPIFRQPPGILEREPINQALETGVLAIDTVIPIGRGQRELIIGDRMTGKTTIAIDTIINQRGKNVICIYCCIGRSQALLDRFIQVLKDNNALEYTIVVAASAANSSGEQYISAYTAATIGEYFMYKGQDVLVVFDDLTKHAWSYRQISLLLERFPGRDAYPGDIFYIHSQLIERAGKLNKKFSGGSMTFLPIVDTLQGDFTGYLPSNLISMTDGQIYLNSSIFNEGTKPAIDLGLSVSRIGSKVQCSVLRELSAKLRLQWTQYYQLLKTSRFRTELSVEAQILLKRGAALNQLFKQEKEEVYSLKKEILLLAALDLKMLDNCSELEIKQIKDNIEEFFNHNFPDILEGLVKAESFTADLKLQLHNGLKRFFEYQKKANPKV